MFTIEKYLSNPVDSTELTITVGGEEFLIRRTPGSEMIDSSEVEKPSEKYLDVLAKQVLDGDTKKPIGREYAKRFLDINPRTAMRVVAEILTESNKLYEEEAKIFEEEVKNSEGIDTESSTGNTASDSVSTLKSTDQAENI